MYPKTGKKGKNRPHLLKTRKQLRKEERKNKKIRRNDYYTNRKKPGQFVLLNNKNQVLGANRPHKNEEMKLIKNERNQKVKKPVKNKVLHEEKVHPQSQMLSTEQVRAKEKRQQVKLQQEMNKQRKKQLLEANFEEDRNIKRLEKQLKLHKRKSKSVPASFARDGLDFLLEVCDPENMKNSALAEKQLTDVNDDFEEDLILMTGGNKKSTEAEDDDDSENEAMGSDYEDSSDESVIETKKKDTRARKESVGSDFSDLDEDPEENSDDLGEDSDNFDDSSDEDQDEHSEDEPDKSTAQKRSAQNVVNDKNKKRKISSDSDNEEFDDYPSANPEEALQSEEKVDGTWEDIYGRLRAKDGSILTEKTAKYVPPAARMLDDTSTDKARTLKLEKLKKQLKGLVNKLAESNMHSIASQIEELYMSNSRNDMNTTITNLITNAVVTNILAPERLLMEHVLLIVILHANVGTEVGAHFLQTVIKQFNEDLNNTDTKKLDNLVIILAQLYNFKMFDSKLIYEIIDKLSEIFEEKHVECILHILKNVGFNLRKDNPIALKNLILSLQKKAAGASEEMKDNSRVKFMLDILLAIKNNNVTKIPNYDTTYSEHLKKIMKGFIRKGNYVTQLNISLEDLLKAEEKGKWWVVGSAWTGNASEDTTSFKNAVEKPKPSSFSQKLLELASKQRMNTDTRKNIFCIIMSAEDYLDAFEKLLRLALKNQQEREIIHVILHCCLQEKSYNPYYATLAQKFCEYDRKYQMTIKYSIWDKLKALNDHSATQISHLAKLLSHLFLEKGLPISTLKIVQFSELDKVSLRFIRQILLGILLHEDLEECKSVFEKVAQSDKLKMFKESLRLFLHHFLLRNLESQGIAEDKKELLQQRVKVVEKLLSKKESGFRY